MYPFSISVHVLLFAADISLASLAIPDHGGDQGCGGGNRDDQNDLVKGVETGPLPHLRASALHEYPTLTLF